MWQVFLRTIFLRNVIFLVLYYCGRPNIIFLYVMQRMKLLRRDIYLILGSHFEPFLWTRIQSEIKWTTQSITGNIIHDVNWKRHDVNGSKEYFVLDVVSRTVWLKWHFLDIFHNMIIWIHSHRLCSDLEIGMAFGSWHILLENWKQNRSNCFEKQESRRANG